MIKALKLSFLAMVCVGIMACSATSVRESTGEYLDSTAVTAKVKAKLIDTLGPRAFKINVQTFKDEVQLSGFVNSDIVKKRAGVIAASVEDVKSVRNDLIVK
ncbi:BON domain-containing protein [Legionella impletisoli]|uniref:BON domain-containing protein n=1 Tax=Legionella impletisoli TaxID=343510 RepID=A0A917NDS1_9GAMM|nr:BON domain-containing protein [Legionella impletisoli]GGI92889.1 BON domain-containing protein [Legionella impletisoli]